VSGEKQINSTEVDHLRQWCTDLSTRAAIEPPRCRRKCTQQSPLQKCFIKILSPLPGQSDSYIMWLGASIRALRINAQAGERAIGWFTSLWCRLVWLTLSPKRQKSLSRRRQSRSCRSQGWAGGAVGESACKWERGRVFRVCGKTLQLQRGIVNFLRLHSPTRCNVKWDATNNSRWLARCLNHTSAGWLHARRQRNPIFPAAANFCPRARQLVRKSDTTWPRAVNTNNVVRGGVGFSIWTWGRHRVNQCSSAFGTRLFILVLIDTLSRELHYALSRRGHSSQRYVQRQQLKRDNMQPLEKLQRRKAADWFKNQYQLFKN